MYKLTVEEKREIDTTMAAIVKDLHNILNASGLSEISRRIKFQKLGYINPKIVINHDSIYICRKKNTEEKDKMYIEENGAFSVSSSEKGYHGDIEFIKKYERNKKIIERFIERRIGKKEENIASLKEVQKRLSKEDIRKSENAGEAEIELDLPETANRHQIEIMHENGRNIGIVDFGGRTVKIMTDGDIVLVDRDKQNEKLKIKKK